MNMLTQAMMSWAQIKLRNITSLKKIEIPVQCLSCPYQTWLWAKPAFESVKALQICFCRFHQEFQLKINMHTFNRYNDYNIIRHNEATWHCREPTCICLCCVWSPLLRELSEGQWLLICLFDKEFERETPSAILQVKTVYLWLILGQTMGKSNVLW